MLNPPFLNIGLRNSSFAWHVEDSHMLSMNICWKGEKTWYFLPRSEASKLEALSKNATKDYASCSFILRHKVLMIPPSTLEKEKIKFGKVYISMPIILSIEISFCHENFISRDFFILFNSLYTIYR